MLGEVKIWIELIREGGLRLCYEERFKKYFFTTFLFLKFLRRPSYHFKSLGCETSLSEDLTDKIKSQNFSKL